MEKSALRIVFIGTPTFAVATLEALIENNFNVVAVITAPDKPAGRGLQLQASEVKQYALTNNLPVLQPTNLKNEDFISTLKSYEADLQVVVAFRMLPEVVWNMPQFGTFNVHASLLPNYRGAAPINWVIINGEKHTGVSTFKLKHAIDTGNILLQQKVAIQAQDTAGTLHDTLMQIGGNLMVETLEKLLENNLVEQNQNLEVANLLHANKLFKETCEIDFTKSAEQVHNLVRGLSPYPTAFTSITDKKNVAKKIKFFETACTNNKVPTENATNNFVTDNKTFLHFACADYYIAVLDLQLEGKKRMSVVDFLRGVEL